MFCKLLRIILIQCFPHPSTFSNIPSRHLFCSPYFLAARSNDILSIIHFRVEAGHMKRKLTKRFHQKIQNNARRHIMHLIRYVRFWRTLNGLSSLHMCTPSKIRCHESVQSFLSRTVRTCRIERWLREFSAVFPIGEACTRGRSDRTNGLTTKRS